jgi:hypothetical protein
MHADLNLSNIIVNNGRIEAIIDWEHAGFYPSWAERWFSRVWGDEATDQLFDPIWEELFPEIDAKTFGSTILQPISEVITAWRSCKIEHSEELHTWFRRGFRECKPYGGLVRKRCLGAKLEHKIDYNEDKPNLNILRGS